jgi:hypothetical protein
MEYSSANVKLTERKELPPGVWEFKDNGEAVKVADYVDDDYEAAADRVRAALEGLK